MSHEDASQTTQYMRAAVEARRDAATLREHGEGFAKAVAYLLGTDIGTEWQGTGTTEEHAVACLRAALARWREGPGREKGAKP